MTKSKCIDTITMEVFTMTEKIKEIIIQNLRQSKYKFMNIDDVSDILKNVLKNNYKSEIGMKVKESLLNDERIDFFKQGYYFHDNKSYYCNGNWIAIKGVYDSPVQAKSKRGWSSIQTKDDENWWEE